MDYVKGTPVVLADWVTGSMTIFPSELARRNAEALQEHLRSEWNDDTDATMATMHHDDPYQRIPALGVDVTGFDAVRDYYLARFESWPGPAFRMDRLAITDEFAAIEGNFRVKPTAQFAGRDAAGRTVDVPTVVWITFRDGKLVGEMVYLDGDVVKRQLA